MRTEFYVVMCLNCRHGTWGTSSLELFKRDGLYTWMCYWCERGGCPTPMRQLKTPTIFMIKEALQKAGRITIWNDKWNALR